jgi:hypothetical protein
MVINPTGDVVVEAAAVEAAAVAVEAAAVARWWR